MTSKSKLLWVGPSEAPANVQAAVAASYDLVAAHRDRPLGGQLARSPLAMIHPNGSSNDPGKLIDMIDELDRSSTVAVFLLHRDAHIAWSTLGSRSGQFLCIRDDAPPGELSATLAVAAALQPTIQNLKAELGEARTANAQPTPNKQVDEEMRLAARLQRDFLPRRLPEVGPARFGVLYRPASFVSGDIYDVTRLDETHVGFYVADVVGHGMPAALLTMFIKKALQTKRVIGSSYKIIPPDVSLAALNADICLQNLSGCPFCTAIYCVLDTASLTLTFSRGGHPEPILISADGEVSRPSALGSLLGVFEAERFDSTIVQLHPGDRLMLYTDGAEDALRRPDNPAQPLESIIKPYLRRSREELLINLTTAIDKAAGKFRPVDDVTVLVMDIAK